MKKYISLFFTVVLCFVLHCAYADRFVNATDCKNVNDFFDAIEMGTCSSQQKLDTKFQKFDN